MIFYHTFIRHSICFAMFISCGIFYVTSFLTFLLKSCPGERLEKKTIENWSLLKVQWWFSKGANFPDWLDATRWVPVFPSFPPLVTPEFRLKVVDGGNQKLKNPMDSPECPKTLENCFIEFDDNGCKCKPFTYSQKTEKKNRHFAPTKPCCAIKDMKPRTHGFVWK